MSKYFKFIFVIAFSFLSACSSSGSSGGTSDTGPDDDGDATQTFTSGDVSLTSATTTSGDSKTSVVTDSDGATQATVTITREGVSIAFPDVSGTTDITFSTALDELPTDYACNLLATYIIAEMQDADTSGLVIGRSIDCRVNRDSPGCDWFPDTQCTLGCCADHDLCYDENDCGASSWIPFVGSDACKNCNEIAAGCIMLGCAGAIDSATEDRCYDNRCHEFYDCDDGSCDCTSPCEDVIPNPEGPESGSGTVCGNGSCEVDEDETNCPGDCVDGSGENTCCVETSGCPDETTTECGAGCCCCGLGEVCSATTNLCASSRPEEDSSRAGGGISKLLYWNY